MSMLTTEEAAALTGLSRARVSVLASERAAGGVKVAWTWLVDRESVLECHRVRQGRPGGRRRLLPAEPLLRQVALRGGRVACGVEQHSAEERALDRAQLDGWLTLAAADELAVGLLGLHPLLLWGDAWLDA